MALCAEALDLIKSFEGYLKPLNDGTGRVKPYLCPAGVPTLGWGNTRYPDGSKVKMTDPPVTRERATELLASELREDEASVQKNTLGVVWHELMYGAATSFTYNCGSGAFRGSGFRKAILDKRWDDVPRELRKWRMGGGRVLAGLARRREAEAAMFMAGVAIMRRGGPVQKTVPTVVPAANNQPAAQPRSGIFTKMFRWVFK